MRRAVMKAASLIAFVVARLGSAAGSNTCGSRLENRQLDFWVGDWNVEETGAPGKTIASSHEEKSIGGCVLVENYEEGPDYTGKSLNFYDPVLKKWRQTWTDSTGGVSEFRGAFDDGAMRLEGETHTATGKLVLRKMVLTPLGPDKVRQHPEASIDGGKTWKTNYDYTYVRKK
jgi:hypothetical protein